MNQLTEQKSSLMMVTIFYKNGAKESFSSVIAVGPGNKWVGIAMEGGKEVALDADNVERIETIPHRVTL